MGITRRIYFSDILLILISILLAIGIRFLVLSTSPTLIPGGDAPGYVAYARELIQNHFVIPASNQIHYPGSIWIYPPLLLYLWSVIMSVAGNSLLAPFYIIEVSGIIADSLVIIPLFLVTKKIFGRKPAVIAALLYTVYLPDLYVLTWGGIPQLFATFLYAWLIYFTIRISRCEGNGVVNTIALGSILALLTLTHDLTIFVALFVLACIAVISVLLRYIKPGGIDPDLSHLTSLAKSIPVAILISAPFLYAWYAPRLWWLLDAGAPYINQNIPGISSQSTSLWSILSSGFVGYFSPLTVGVVLVPVAIYCIYIMMKHNPEKNGVLALFVVLPILVAVIDFHDPIIVARLGYYSFLPALIATSYGFSLIGSKKPKMRGNGLKHRKRVLAAIMIPIILVSSAGVGANMYYHTFYNSYINEHPGDVIDYSALKWIHSNVPANSTVASFGEFGYFVMGYDGNPTIVYQNLKYLTQPAEWNESIAAYYLVYHPSYNITTTQLLIHKYHISYVAGMSNVTVPSFYNEVYKNGIIEIYSVNGS